MTRQRFYRWIMTGFIDVQTLTRVFPDQSRVTHPVNKPRNSLFQVTGIYLKDRRHSTDLSLLLAEIIVEDVMRLGFLAVFLDGDAGATDNLSREIK